MAIVPADSNTNYSESRTGSQKANPSTNYFMFVFPATSSVPIVDFNDHSEHDLHNIAPKVLSLRKS